MAASGATASTSSSFCVTAFVSVLMSTGAAADSEDMCDRARKPRGGETRQSAGAGSYEILFFQNRFLISLLSHATKSNLESPLT